MKKKCVILIPALNPPESFCEYINELICAGFDRIIVVDDGSDQKKIFQDISCHPEVKVLTHERNFGKGKALRTGFDYYSRYVKKEEYCGIITADSDGQHLVEDVRKVQQCLAEEKGKLVLGVRNFNQENVPPKSRFGNKLTSLIFRIFLGLRISDTQTGLRGIPNSLVQACLNIGGDRFEYETSMLIEVGKTAGTEEVEIHTVYYDQNQGTHFHPIKDSFRIYKILFGTFFRYLFISLSSFLLDIMLFAVGTKIIFQSFYFCIPASTVLARIFSGIYNYIMNRNIVFKSKASYLLSGVSYLTLCIVQMAASAVFVSIIYSILQVDEVLVKIIVDTCLFFVSYQLQKHFIFR